MSVIRVLLRSVIDYAGLFPPAGLDMAATVKNYASYRRGDHRWALGRLILPVSRLEEFESAAHSLFDPADPWPLSVLGGSNLSADLKAIASFGARRRDARILSLEIKAGTVEEIRSAAAAIGSEIETFYEIPIADNPVKLIGVIQEVKGMAKVRTGGTKPGMVPPPEELGRFIHLAHSRVEFKATAGLHHALRSMRPLTYETGCDSDLMHGFLNVFVAATFAFLELDRILPSILDEQDIRGFDFGAAGLQWHGHEAASEKVELTRSSLARSFGSCSFEEPIAELKELKLL